MGPAAGGCGSNGLRGRGVLCLGQAALAVLVVVAGGGCLFQAPSPPVQVRRGPCPDTLKGKESPEPGVALATRCTYYRVRGESAEEAREFMSAWGPSDETGTYDAYTNFDLRYRYDQRAGVEGCSTGPVAVELHLVHILPEWSPPASSPPAVVKRWGRFTKRLAKHEAGHADINLRAANELSRSFSELPAFSSCAALRQAAHEVFVRVVAALKKEHRRYDRRTIHGLTQGSVFP